MYLVRNKLCDLPNAKPTPLIKAVLDGNNQLTRDLITQGVDVNLADSKEEITALMAAAYIGNMESAKILIDAGADVNLRNRKGQTSLFYSATYNSKEISLLLIESGADVNVFDMHGLTPLHCAAGHNSEDVARLLMINKDDEANVSQKCVPSPLFIAVAEDNEEIARLLIEAGADVNETDGEVSLLYIAAAENWNEKISRLLIEKGADVNEWDCLNYRSLLHEVARGANDEIARLLVEEGADVNNRDEYGRTPLFYLVGMFVRYDDKPSDIKQELTRKVASACSDIDIRDCEGRTALSYAIEIMNECEGYKPLARILIDAGANVNNIGDKEGQTPLFYAFTPSTVQFLLEHGADLSVRNDQLETVLIHAMRSEHFFKNAKLLAGISRAEFYKAEFWLRFFKTFVENVTSKCDINARDMYGRTAIFYAVSRCHNFEELKAIAGVLLDQGALLNVTDNNDVSVLSYFIETYCQEDYYKKDENEELKAIAAVLRYQAAFLNASNNNDVNVSMSHFIERCCQEDHHKEDENEMVKPLDATLTFFKENDIQDSTIADSALNCLYAILPKHINNHEKGDNLFAYLLLEVASNHASCSRIDEIYNLLIERKIPESLDFLFHVLGVNPNSADSYGNTALHYASLIPFETEVPHESIMKILQTLESHGVRFNVKNLANETPLHLCLSAEKARLSTTLVVDICTFLLKDASLVREVTKNGESVYHLIIKLLRDGLSVNDWEIQKCICSNTLQLLDLVSKTSGKQSNVHVLKMVDCKLNSPLHLWASLSLAPPLKQYYTDHVTGDLTFQMLLDVILKHLLKPGMTPNPRNENDQTPLHLCKTWTAVKLLIGAGANSSVLDIKGQSPLVIVARQIVKSGFPWHFFPDVEQDPKTLFKECVSLNLDIWGSDNQSILTVLLKYEIFELANALVEIACESNPSVLKQFVETICKDDSPHTKWKSLLIKNILTSKIRRPFDIDPALRSSIVSIIKLRDETNHTCIHSLDFNNRQRLSPTDKALQSVHADIVKQLRLHGADGNKFMDLFHDFPELQHILTTEIDLDDVPMSIPWTSVSKMHENKLARIARKQNVQKIGTYWFHEESIGSGSFGHVFAGINEHDGREIAIKKIERLRMVRPEDKREITNLKALSDCPNIVNYIFFDDSDKDFVYIVLELMEGDLDEYFACCSFDVNRCATLCKDVVEGLAYLHQIKPKPILHRDLKPGNILYKLHPELCLKIADFGLSSPLTTTDGPTVRGTVVGTRCWIAPEVISSKPSYSQSSDVFACGLLLHYILSSQKHPFSPKDCTNKTSEVIDVETQSNMLKFEMEGWNRALSPEAAHLIKGMLQQDNCKRLSITESLGHPFFWSNKKKIAFLSAVGNQHEFQCPPTIKAAAHCPTTGVEADLENGLASIVLLAKWDDPNYRDMTKVVTEMRTPIERFNKKGKTYYENPRPYDTGSVVELVRFIRNAIAHVSESTRPRDIKKLILEDFVFLKEFPHLLIEVYKALTAHGWGNRDEIKYVMISED